MPPQGSPKGIEAVYLAHRDKLIRFLIARGAGDAAEDLVQELWLKVSGRPEGPVGNPLAYLFRAADTLMIDRYRSRRQAERRDRAWGDALGSGEMAEDPSADRVVAARQESVQVADTLAALGSRRETIFRQARLQGIAQRQIAADMGLSLSTVESDLRIACRALAELKERLR